jgi:5-methylcytosine-specific restriction endonuclease McrA
VLDANKKPLDPCHPARARQLLKSGKATIYRYYPFTIILKERLVENSITHPHRVKIDPGAKVTGLALVRDDIPKVVWAAELKHRGETICQRMLERASLRRSRRSRKTRYRKPRFLNRRKPEGWLPPSLESRVVNVITWVKRLIRWCPVSAISLELVKFDTQKLQNPEISGIEYQQGTLFGYEVREYLLEKWGRKCAYCGRENVPLEIEHIIPKSRGGTNRVSNLTLACHECNQRKGNMTAAEFGYPHIQAQAGQSLKDAAAVNSTRWAIFKQIKELNLPVEMSTGGVTKYNRTRLGLPKTHWVDAACVGESTPEKLFIKCSSILVIKATGHGRRQRCRTDKYGFPVAHAPRQKKYMGFQTGDLVQAIIPKGKYAGVHVCRIAIRYRPSFKLNGFDVHPKYLRVLQRCDGYEYELRSVSSPDLKAGAPDAA